VKVGDLVKLLKPIESERSWRGIVVRLIPSRDYVDGEWEIHWLHHPPKDLCYEYGYQLEVVSESR